MATRSLGTLTLDLIAKIGGFEKGMDKAEKRTQKWRAEVKRNVEAAGKAFAAGATVVTGALAAMTVSAANNAKDIQNLAQVANTGAEDFQRYAYAAKSVGVEQDKLADIFKDTSDKVGDFLQTGGGALADFFENIAPQVGVTADQFRDLSGPQALGLYVDSLEKANLSQSEMTFYLEAIASDATLLLPLLRNNAKGFEDLADRADQAGIVLSEIELQQLVEVDRDIADLTKSMGSLRNQIVLGAAPAIRDILDLLSDPELSKEIVELARDIGSGLGNALKTASAAAIGAYTTFELVGKGIATIAAAISASDLDFADLAFPPAAAAKVVKNFGDIKSTIEIGLDDISQTALEAADALDDVWSIGEGSPTVPVKIEPEPLDTTDLRFDEVAAELEKEFGNIDIGLQGILGDLDAELAQESAKKVADSLKDYQSLVRDLRTDEEVLTDQVRERLAVLEAVSGLTDEQRNQTLGRIADAATVDAPEFSGGDTTEAQAELEDWYNTQLELLNNYRQERADLNAIWNEKEGELEQEYQERLTEITTANEEARRQQMLDGYSAILGVVGSFYEGMEGEEAAYARAAIAIGQTLLDEKKRNALQSIIASTQSAAMGAYEALASIPYVGPFLGAAAAGGIYIAGGLAAAEVSGLAHDGIDSIPEDGTWLLEKGERVTTAETSAKLDRTLANIEQGMGGNNRSIRGGGDTYNFNVAGDLNRETAAQTARESERRQRMTARRLGS